MRTVETENCVVTFPDDQATKDAVFDRVVAFFLEHEAFSGESVMQCDAPQIEGPVMLSELVDDVLKFDAKDKSDLSAPDGHAPDDRYCPRCGAALHDDQKPGPYDTCVGESSR